MAFLGLCMGYPTLPFSQKSMYPPCASSSPNICHHASLPIILQSYTEKLQSFTQVLLSMLWIASSNTYREKLFYMHSGYTFLNAQGILNKVLVLHSKYVVGSIFLIKYEMNSNHLYTILKVYTKLNQVPR